MQCITIMITLRKKKKKKTAQAVLITIVMVVLYPASQSCLLLAGITCHVTCLLESTTFAPVYGAYQRKAEILNPGFCSLKTGSQPSKDWPTPLQSREDGQIVQQSKSALLVALGFSAHAADEEA